MNVSEIKEALRQRNLPVTGRKAELAARLSAAQKEEEFETQNFTPIKSRRSRESRHYSGDSYSNIITLLFVFSLTFLGFICVFPFQSQQWLPFPSLQVADIIDLASPLVLLPLYYALCPKSTSSTFNVLFTMMIGLWACGHGMHLSSNSINNLGVKDTQVQELVYFFDEILSHYLWHFGMVILSLLISFASLQHPIDPKTIPDHFLGRFSATLLSTMAALIHGFCFFAATVEGQTSQYIIPALGIGILNLFGMSWSKSLPFQQTPQFMFFFLTAIVAFVLQQYWKLLNHGNSPEFSSFGAGEMRYLPWD